MISDKVDLTENRDFGAQNLEISNFLNSAAISRAIRINSLQTISREDYEVWCLREKFFGVRNHTCESWDLFHTEETFVEELRTHCQRCGREFRIPWKCIDDLCPECDEIISSSFHRFPWVDYYGEQVQQGDMRDNRGILSLR